MPKPPLEGITLRSIIETMARIKLIKIILDLDPSVVGDHKVFICFT
jgi:hypothetical protein